MVTASAETGVARRTKRSEPQAGYEMQQAHGSLAEETVEVVRNHEGGTRRWPWWPDAEVRLSSLAGVDASREMSAGRRGESHKRRCSGQAATSGS
jgi:hypothetical protein